MAWSLDINWYSNSNKKTVRDHPLNRHNLPPQVSRNFFLTNFLQVWCIFQQVEIVSRKQFCQMLYKEPREETFSWKEGPAQTKETTCLSKTKGTWDKKEGNIGKRTKVLAKYDVTVYKTEPDENLPPFTCKKTTATVGWRGRFLARWSWLQRFCCSYRMIGYAFTEELSLLACSLIRSWVGRVVLKLLTVVARDLVLSVSALEWGNWLWYMGT